jgi:hypothetical protein
MGYYSSEDSSDRSRSRSRKPQRFDQASPKKSKKHRRGSDGGYSKRRKAEGRQENAVGTLHAAHRKKVAEGDRRSSETSYHSGNLGPSPGVSHHAAAGGSGVRNSEYSAAVPTTPVPTLEAPTGLVLGQRTEINCNLIEHEEHGDMEQMTQSTMELTKETTHGDFVARVRKEFPSLPHNFTLVCRVTYERGTTTPNQTLAPFG